MVLVDYFSWQREGDDEPYGLVTVYFSSFEVYLSHLVLDILNVYSTRSKAKEAGVIDPHVEPEHQKPDTTQACQVSSKFSSKHRQKAGVRSVEAFCRPATRM